MALRGAGRRSGGVELIVVGMGGQTTIECCDDGIEDGAAFLQDCDVPEAKDGIAVGVQPFRSDDVVFIVSMLGAVELNDQIFLATDEVGDIGTKRDLPREFMTVKTAVSEIAPEVTFRFGFILPQLASAAGGS